MIEKTSHEHHLHVSLHDITPEHAAGAGVIKPGYAPRLTNVEGVLTSTDRHDLLRQQSVGIHRQVARGR